MWLSSGTCASSSWITGSGMPKAVRTWRCLEQLSANVSATLAIGISLHLSINAVSEATSKCSAANCNVVFNSTLVGQVGVTCCNKSSNPSTQETDGTSHARWSCLKSPDEASQMRLFRAAHCSSGCSNVAICIILNMHFDNACRFDSKAVDPTAPEHVTTSRILENITAHASASWPNCSTQDLSETTDSADFFFFVGASFSKDHRLGFMSSSCSFDRLCSMASAERVCTKDTRSSIGSSNPSVGGCVGECIKSKTRQATPAQSGRTRQTEAFTPNSGEPRRILVVKPEESGSDEEIRAALAVRPRAITRRTVPLQAKSCALTELKHWRLHRGADNACFNEAKCSSTTATSTVNVCELSSSAAARMVFCIGSRT
mmetsp:Transcript_730/g.1639  ORF Transcript_730/g.1639 Transcript_730/m.1639 type:complete len:373 (-) Transcript_730:2184-3302(-)